jgi:hypothetical protein
VRAPGEKTPKQKKKMKSMKKQNKQSNAINSRMATCSAAEVQPGAPGQSMNAHGAAAVPSYNLSATPPVNADGRFMIPTETLRWLVIDPRSLCPGTAPSGQEDFITKKELAARLKVSTRTISNWQRYGAVPFVKCGRSVYYNWAAVVAHLQNHFRVCRGTSVQPQTRRINHGGTERTEALARGQEVPNKLQ